MKKFIAKIALFSIASLMMISTASADGANDGIELSKMLDDAATKPCIEIDPPGGKVDAGGKPVYKPGKDYTKIITIIEEPLFPQKSTPGPDSNGFEYRSCFRNAFQYEYDIKIKANTAGGKGKSATERNIISELSTECSKKAQSAIKNNNYKKNNIKFSCTEVQAILCADGGTCMLYGYLSMIYKWGASLVGIIAVAVVVLSGIQISTAGGDPEAVTSAKNRILKSLTGIAVLFLAGLILYTVNPTFYTN